MGYYSIVLSSPFIVAVYVISLTAYPALFLYLFSNCLLLIMIHIMYLHVEK